MANEKDFKSLIDEQKRTTGALAQIAKNTSNTGNEVEDSSKKRERSESELAADGVRREKALERLNKRMGVFGAVKNTFGKVGKFLMGSKSKDKEKSKDEKSSANSRFKKLGETLLGPLKSMKDSLLGFGKKAVGGIGSLFKFGLMGAALLIAKNFLESPKWEEWKTKLIPALVTAFEFISSTLKSAGATIIKGITSFKTLFTTGVFDKDGNFIGVGATLTLLKDALAGLGVGFLALGLLLAPKAIGMLAIKTAVGTFKLAMTALKFFFSTTLYKKVFDLVATGAKGAGGAILGAVGKVGKALTALRLFMMSSLLPAIGGMLASFAPLLIPLLPIVAIAAGVALVIASIKNAFDDFKTTLDETGSIFEAIKVGFASFIANLLGIIPNLILDLIGWVGGLFGFDGFKETLQNIDVVKFIKDGLISLFTGIGNFVSNLYEDYIKPLLAPLLKFLDPVINVVKKVFNAVIDFLSPIINAVKKVMGFLKRTIGKLADTKLGRLLGFGKGDSGQVPDVEDIQRIPIEATTLKDLPRQDTPDVNALLPGMGTAQPMMAAAPTVISAPSSTNNVQHNHQNISKTVVEPDVYFQRQAGFAI
jgi:hypothetical protein